MKVQPVVAFVKTIERYCENRESDGQTGDGGPRAKHRTSVVNHVLGPVLRAAKWPAALTERECKIIVLVGRGLSNKVIAHHLYTSNITVRHHLTSIFDKLGVTTRQKFLIRAHRYNLVESGAFASPFSGDR